MPTHGVFAPGDFEAGDLLQIEFGRLLQRLDGPAGPVAAEGVDELGVSENGERRAAPDVLPDEVGIFGEAELGVKFHAATKNFTAAADHRPHGTFKLYEFASFDQEIYGGCDRFFGGEVRVGDTPGSEKISRSDEEVVVDAFEEIEGEAIVGIHKDEIVTTTFGSPEVTLDGDVAALGSHESERGEHFFVGRGFGYGLIGRFRVYDDHFEVAERLFDEVL